MKFGAFLVVGFALIKICVCRGPILLEPQSLNATDIQSRNLAISWQKPVNDDNQTISFTVFYKESKIAKCWEELPDLKDTKATLQPLKPYRTYDIFVMANANGTYGAPTPRYNVQTAEAVPESCPKQDYTFDDPSEPSIFAWDEVPEDDRNGKILGYTIFYRNSSMPNGTYYEVNVTGFNHLGYLNTDHTFNFTRESGFSFKVAAYNSKGYCKGYETLDMWEPTLKTTSSPTPTPTLLPSTQVTSVKTTLPEVTATQQLQSSSVIIAASSAISPSSTSPSPTQKVTPEKPETTQQACPTSTQKPCTCPPFTQEPTEQPAEKLSRTKNNDWLKYIAIALAVIVVIMGITIFILIWQLYKNHRFYKLRRDQAYKMTTHDQVGHENQAQDNP